MENWISYLYQKAIYESNQPTCFPLRRAQACSNNCNSLIQVNAVTSNAPNSISIEWIKLLFQPQCTWKKNLGEKCSVEKVGKVMTFC